jgi:tetratricopeptide (TPR) repeat protein
MKRMISFLALLFAFFNTAGQAVGIDSLRAAGFQAKSDGDYEAAIGLYSKIIDIDPADYDARLALGRLYIQVEDYADAIYYFNQIYREDSTDVEALNGLGESYGATGQDRKSVFYYEKSLSYYSDDINQYFVLAKAYANSGKTEKAIEVYRATMNFDSTYSEAWAGIGKMYYWMGMPATAAKYYEKALELDPGNEEMTREYNSVKSELNYSLTLSVGPNNETEENYEINALISKIGFEKRIGDRFKVQAGFLLDYSNRNYTGKAGDTTRWYDNTWAKFGWLNEHNNVTAFGGYSFSDNKFSSYGLNWKVNFNFGKFYLGNSLGAGYDYFYYWNKVGSHAITEEFQVRYSRFGFEASYAAGLVDEVTVIDYSSGGEIFKDYNPYQSYNLSLTYKIIRNPGIKIGLQHSYLDYKYKSPLYYSPSGRFLTGAMASVYYQLSGFFVYGSFHYNIGSENNYEEDDAGEIDQVSLDVNNWSASLEIGYDYYPFSFSIGGSNFYNPYYQNINGFASLKVLF